MGDKCMMKTPLLFLLTKSAINRRKFLLPLWAAIRDLSYYRSTEITSSRFIVLFLLTYKAWSQEGSVLYRMRKSNINTKFSRHSDLCSYEVLCDFIYWPGNWSDKIFRYYKPNLRDAKNNITLADSWCQLYIICANFLLFLTRDCIAMSNAAV